MTTKSAVEAGPPLAAAIDAACAAAQEFAVVWAGGDAPRWFAADGVSAGRARFCAQSFAGAPTVGLWAGWPAVADLAEQPWPEAAPARAAERFSTSRFTDADEPAAFAARVRAVLADIADGSLDKLVLHRRRVARRQAGSIGAALSQLGPPSAGETVFLWHRPDQGSFLGRTPETLCQIQDGLLRVDALAGTGDNGPALEASDKDRREHDIVCADVVAALGAVATAVRCHPAHAVRFGDLYHLRSEIEATLHPGVTAANVVTLLHPTPAVGGSPRERVLGALARYESEPRGYYAAPLGVVEAAGPDRGADARVVVALRCALVQGDRVTLFGGAGLVRGSDPDAEWRETAAKMRPLARAWEAP